MIKKLLICLLFANVASAQKTTSNFYDIQKSFYEYWNDKDRVEKDVELQNDNDGVLEQFQRWEHFMAPRVYPSGNFDPNTLWNEYKNYNAKSRSPLSSTPTANWTLLGPVAVPGSGGGAGRINVVEFDPVNSNIMWVGAADGGLWKSINGGTAWTSNTDLLPNISVADIAIDPLNTNNMYLATGDGSGYEAAGPFWGGTYSAGILKSTDGGTTWNTTGLTYTQDQQNIVQRLIVHPTNPQILLAAARDGIWRSADGGTTWNSVNTGHFFDLEFNVSNPSIVYAASENVIKRIILP